MAKYLWIYLFLVVFISVFLAEKPILGYFLIFKLICFNILIFKQSKSEEDLANNSK